ncbi:acyl-CoA dehydrogenase [Fulvitalea axinellae]|uniref:Acyl-CoA dehydrogenase n=1 Tax=Fulvitalea axinellae TaxID=1182444 RepID=A0AAU9CI12_9BACT|nr:acyl-CoA dehydrogenase [Fulvitalea axinellae]
MYFNDEHKLFRESVRDFLAQRATPFANEWETQRRIPKSIWEEMGDQGYLGLLHEEKHGGLEADIFFSLIFLEELANTGFGGFAGAVSVHSYMATAHLAKAGSETLKRKYLEPAIEGRKVGALAISEPGAGSDVSSLRTRAEDMGDHYLLNGSKIFITNGFYADFITVAAQTEKGMSLFVIEGDNPGLSRNKLEKMGWHCSDTAELFFENAVVPKENLIGEEGKGFYYIMDSFQIERLCIAIISQASAERMFDLALKYARERDAFGKKLEKMKNIRYQLADVHADIACVKQYLRHVAWNLERGENMSRECAIAKLKATELSKEVADKCLQIFGGYGYMADFEIERMFRDARVNTIIGGTSDIMKEIIGKSVIDERTYKSAYQNH